MMRAPDELVDRATRDGAASVVGALAEWKPKLLGKAGLVPAIVETCVGIMARADASSSRAGALFMSQPLQRLRAEEEALIKARLLGQQPPHGGAATTTTGGFSALAGGGVAAKGGDDDDDDDAYEGPTVQELAQTTLDQVALHVPQKYSLEPTMGLAVRCLRSDDQAARRAGAATIGVVAEGFQDALRERHLGDVLALLEQAARQSDAATRECLCFAYGQLAEHCQPEIVAFAARVVPVVFEFLDDARAAVVGTACYVLETFCESMDGDQIAPLLPDLIERLLVLLAHELTGIREMAAAAMGSAAVAASDAFAPYLPRAADALTAMCALEREDAWELRGRALEALGHVALAVGPDRFAPYRDAAIVSASQNLKLDSTELAEYSYGFFANVAKVLRADIAGLLSELVPHLLDVIARRDGATFDYEDDDDDDDDAGGPRMGFLDTDDGGAIEAEDGADWDDVGDGARAARGGGGDDDDDDDD
eukprot:CAMPEP_0185695796 /NCGR_PEP_ID=MMETSP1164-20130828/4745_1 /TAXON_ID=1104430 /ORGANISM="Chrysoreinhardia sp, Strain CCMP2950" /LENGTH=479 /DNA_ID=CAMNT_0028362663 /DNA_START=3 /DNA_END=1439 /DNA_ORIENTATION=+